MRRGLTRYDEELGTPASTEDESCPSSELDLLKPSFPRSCRKQQFSCRISKKPKDNSSQLFGSSMRNLNQHRPVLSCNHVNTKLLSSNKDKLPTVQRASSLQYFPIQSKKYETQVTFAKEKSSSGGEDINGKSCTKLWLFEEWPRCSNTRPQHPRQDEQSNSRTFLVAPQKDRLESPEHPRPGNSKSSVVVLYHEKSPTPKESSSRRFLQSSHSDQTIAEPSELKRRIGQPSLPDSVRSETPEVSSPVYPIVRRKTTSRRHRRVSRRQEALNVHIYQDGRVLQVPSSTQDRRIASNQVSEGKSRSRETGYLARSAKNLIRSREKTLVCQREDSNVPDRERKSEYCESDRISKGRCRPSDNSVPKLMARPSSGKDNKDSQRRNEIFCPNLGGFMQRMNVYPRERGDNRAFISVNDGGDSQRVFPFQATPSGNLKIIPNQVVFESKKVSVLVAEPQRTKVNVKAELSRPGIEVGRCSSEYSPRTEHIDLPADVTSSAINQLQNQKKSLNMEGEYKTRTHPYKGKLSQMEMEQKQSTSHQLPTIQEVPLSSLGFTSEQPIDWDNIILPEKTDLYQELARRITNYKNADCIVRIDQDEFHCHLLVLQSYSSFFDERNCKEIDLTGSGVSSKAFSIIYDWMITPPMESCHLLQRDNILEIFTAAQHLGVKELEEQCWAFIDNDELFTEDTAFLLYLEAKKIKNTAVMELMVPRIMKFFLMLVSTKDFLELSVEELCLLLKSNYICVNSEMEVLMSAVRWLMHDWNNRKQYMLDVLKCVRFGLIAPWQLVDVKRNPENPEFMELMSYPEIQKMVDDGLAFVIIKYWYGNQTEDYYHWIDLLGLSEPTNRNWAGEDKNYVTYREFLLYLEEYQKTKLSELKTHKSQTIPTPPTSPPNDSSFRTRTHKNHVQNHFHGDVSSSGQTSGVHKVPVCSKFSKVMPGNYLPPGMPDGMPLPPEFVNEYLSNLEKNNSKGVSKSMAVNSGNDSNRKVTQRL